MSEQYDLYGGIPPHVAGSDTSLAAALSQLTTAKTKQARVYREIKWNRSGMTDDEIEVATGWRHQTVSARRRELVKLGAIRDSGERRNTRSGRKATVWTPSD